ncbi:nucleotidyltransferase domain-containing protein [Clostridium akagii]|uniref:nucleotidyltransferase domain-containing protein n=1 Tax=Clostridium akagii TaxID=91623 RepID=UPI00047897BB|nr:nucleotidyltransferase family protein [Clostridium akagii]
MDYIENIVIEILKDEIFMKYENKIEIPTLKWPEVIEFASIHNLSPLIYYATKKLELHLGINKEVLKTWKQQVFLSNLLQVNHIEQIKKVFKNFNDEHINVVVLKGLTLRNLYPKPELRVMSDGDLLLEAKNINKARKILISMGFTEEEENQSPIHYKFIYDKYFAVEIHWTLEKIGFVKDSDSFEKDVRTGLIINNSYGTPVYDLSYENEFVYTVLHMAIHFTSSGFGLRQFIDVLFIIKNRSSYINWDVVYNKLEQCGILKFTSVILAACKMLFNINEPWMGKFQQTQDIFYLNLFISKMLCNDVIGYKNSDEKYERLEKLYVNSKSGIYAKSKFKRSLRALLPCKGELSQKYTYAKKHPMLLPIAWMHRAIFGAFRRDHGLIEKIKIIKIIGHISKTQLELLNWLNLK